MTSFAKHGGAVRGGEPDGVWARRAPAKAKLRPREASWSAPSSHHPVVSDVSVGVRRVRRKREGGGVRERRRTHDGEASDKDRGAGSRLRTATAQLPLRKKSPRSRRRRAPCGCPTTNSRATTRGSSGRGCDQLAPSTNQLTLTGLLAGTMDCEAQIHFASLVRWTRRGKRRHIHDRKRFLKTSTSRAPGFSTVPGGLKVTRRGHPPSSHSGSLESAP